MSNPTGDALNAQLLKSYTKHDSECFKKAGEYEPIFVLRGQDITAVATLQRWIDLNVNRLGFTHPKIVDAVKIRDLMEAWEGRKLPD